MIDLTLDPVLNWLKNKAKDVEKSKKLAANDLGTYVGLTVRLTYIERLITERYEELTGTK